MIKAIVLVPKREDMSSEEFRRYVDEIHLPLVKRLPGLRRLLIHYAHPSPDGTPPLYEGVGEDWFESIEAMQAAFAGPEGRAVMADTAKFADVARMQVLVVDEVEVPLE